MISISWGLRSATAAGAAVCQLHSDSCRSCGWRGELTVQIKQIQAVQGLDYGRYRSVCPRTSFRTEEGVLFLAARCVGCRWLIAEPLLGRSPHLMTGQSAGSKARPPGLNVICLWTAIPASESSTASDGVPCNCITRSTSSSAQVCVLIPSQVLSPKPLPDMLPINMYLSQILFSM